MTVLITLEAQVSSESSGFCEWIALKVNPLDRLLKLDGTGGSAILYFGYEGVNPQILGIRGYNEDGLLLVILTKTYSEKVPVMVGSKIIVRVMGMITKGELVRATMTWKQAHFGVVMSGHSSFPHKGAKGCGAAKGSLPLQPPTLLHPRNSV